MRAVTKKELQYSKELRINEFIRKVNEDMHKHSSDILAEGKYRISVGFGLVGSDMLKDDEKKIVQKAFEDTGDWRVTINENGNTFIFELKDF